MTTLVASKSKDPSTKVGAVIVGEDDEILSIGFNGFPRGVREDLPERWERPEKYEWVVHAEENAILNAARVGTSLKGATLYVGGHPCASCAGSIVQAGISTVVCCPPWEMPDRWKKSLGPAATILEEGGVERRDPVIDVNPFRDA